MAKRKKAYLSEIKLKNILTHYTLTDVYQEDSTNSEKANIEKNEEFYKSWEDDRL